MIKDLTIMDFYSVRDIITSELEQKKTLGKLILKRYPDFDKVIRIMTRELEIALLEDCEEESSLMSKEMFINLKMVAYNLPVWILRYPEYSWHDFVSAFVLLYENYLDVQDQILTILKEREPEEFNENWGLVHQDLNILKEEVYPALKNLATFGVTLKDLVLMAYEVSEELKELRQARPVSMQLSESYLKALDIL